MSTAVKEWSRQQVFAWIGTLGLSLNATMVLQHKFWWIHGQALVLMTEDDISRLCGGNIVESIQMHLKQTLDELLLHEEQRKADLSSQIVKYICHKHILFTCIDKKTIMIKSQQMMIRYHVHQIG